MTSAPARARDALLAKLEMVAALERHFVPIMEMALARMPLTESARERFGWANNLEWWAGSLGPEHLRMTSVVRLATEIELGLKAYYVARKSYPNFSALDSDPMIRPKTIFQRMSPRDQSGVVRLFWSELSVDLNSFTSFEQIRKVFVLRHLYAHRSGVVDDHFIAQYKAVTGDDLLSHPGFVAYPAEDVVWFCSSAEVSRLIIACQSFARELP